MREQALITSSHSTDPLGRAADAMGSAVLAVKEGASEVQTRVSESIPAVGHFLSRMIYNSSYVLSFGVVFPIMLVVRAVPKNNALVYGLVDGALAAQDAVDSWGAAAPPEDLHDLPAHESHAAENGSSSDTMATEHPNHTRRGTKRRGSQHSTSKRSSRKS
jgi:hypothetical protein